MPQVCTECGTPSIPGMVRGHGKCRYHWNAYVWGTEWADKCASGRYELQATGQRDEHDKPIVAWLPQDDE